MIIWNLLYLLINKALKRDIKNLFDVLYVKNIAILIIYRSKYARRKAKSKNAWNPMYWIGTCGQKLLSQ